MEGKFTQEQIIRAYKTLQGLAEKPLKLKLSYQIYKLMKKLQTYFDFQVKTEKELFEKFKPTLAEDGRNFEFESAEDAKEFGETLDTLRNTVIDDLDFKPIRIDLEKEDIEITAKELENLDGFVDFIEGEPDVIVGDPQILEMPSVE